MNAIKTLFIALLATFVLALPAHALSIGEAKAQGLVGELATGYLDSPKGSPSAEVKTLIKDINAKRKAKYQQLAKSQGISLSAVEKLAGEKAFEKTAKGHYIKVPGAGWKKK